MISPKRLDDAVSVAPQILPEDLPALADAGFRSVVCHRPDGEEAGQPAFAEIEAAARAAGLEAVHQPVTTGAIDDEQARAFDALLERLPPPTLAFCRSGTRSASLWALAKAPARGVVEVLTATRAADYDLAGMTRRLAGVAVSRPGAELRHDVVIIGAGAAGTAVAASLLKRRPDLDVALIEPAATHYYQPGWTLVGGGVFTAEQTARPMADVIPRRATRIEGAVVAFEPASDAVILEGGRVVSYRRLVVCPGLELHWEGVEGLTDALGHNGVTSNYRHDLAPYTWKTVQSLRSGRAVFTQPPMPIKCAGAPQKAMYLSADHWRREGRLDAIDVEFRNAGAVLFGVADYVPALMEYVERYGIGLNFGHTLRAVDGEARRAWFDVTADGAETSRVAVDFDMLHVCPPQRAPAFVRVGPLSDEGGWIDVDQGTLRHRSHDNVYALGDVISAPNAKTAAAARKQAPVVARNLLHDMGYGARECVYDGYGSCPLTVERGKIVLAEFGYGGKLLPSFPPWLVDGKRPSRAAWFLKERLLPPLYWRGMLKGREWLARPRDAA